MQEYLLDTYMYIDSYDRYYRKDFFPTYWQQLSEILNSHVVIPIIVRDEITKNDWFLKWLRQHYKRDYLSHKRYIEQWQGVLNHIQTCGLYKESALTAQVRGWANEDIADPWIIAIAKELGLTIVTEEQKVPNLGQGNPVKSAKIPDICDDWGVRCISRNDFFEEVKLTV